MMIMKKILYFTLLAALAVQSCAKEGAESVSQEVVTNIEIVAAVDDTRTFLGDDNKIHWAESGEQLNIIYYSDGNPSELNQVPTNANYIIDEEGRIKFTVDLVSKEGATSHTLGAFYPYQHVAETSSVSLVIAQEQSPMADSYDPKSDILVSREPVRFDNADESVKISFSRMVAFAKMTLKGIGEGETIESVTFSSSAKPAGSVEFKVHEAATLESAVWYNQYEDIRITREDWVAAGDVVVWMTTVPTDLSGTDFSVTVVTDKTTYTKSVDLTDRTLEFKRGDIATFSVAVEPMLDIVGSWKLTQWRGAEPGFDVYMLIDENCSVTHWQRITSREWERYESMATLDGGTISGVYSDGVEWRTSYGVTQHDDTMTWIDRSDATDISVYTRSELPTDLPMSQSETTRSVAERFL